MAWDLAQDLATGDLVWDAKRDLASADGVGLIQQRIHRRLMVERGEYLFDRAGSLGSRLRSLLNMGIPPASAGIEMIIREALAPMDDITILSIQTHTANDGSGVDVAMGSVYARIVYELDLENASLPSDFQGQFQADITLPIS